LVFQPRLLGQCETALELLDATWPTAKGVRGAETLQGVDVGPVVVETLGKVKRAPRTHFYFVGVFGQHTGAGEGAVGHRKLVTWGQLFEQRPGRRAFGGIDGLYLAGSGAHPGGAVTGAPGYLAARAADRLSDLPAVSREMEEVCKAAAEAGDGWTQGRALVTLAEAAVLRDADAAGAEGMIEQALGVLEPDDLTGRFRALRAQATIAWTRGDLAKEERVMEEAIYLARQAGRKDFESEAADELASVYLARLELDRAAPLIEQAILLAEESGSAEARGRALRFAGQLHLYRRELDDAETALESAREYLAEAGAAWALGRTLNYAAWVARHKGDLAKAERLYRESIRILAPLEDRATLCESQRGLAELLIVQGRVDEAESLRACRSRDRRPTRRHLPLDDHDGTRSRPCRSGARRRSRAAAAGGLRVDRGQRAPDAPGRDPGGPDSVPARPRPGRRGRGARRAPRGPARRSHAAPNASPDQNRRQGCSQVHSYPGV